METNVIRRLFAQILEAKNNSARTTTGFTLRMSIKLF
jgi:hypothetical protein